MSVKRLAIAGLHPSILACEATPEYRDQLRSRIDG